MNNYLRYFFIIFLISLIFFSFSKPVFSENTNVVLEFFIYSSYCDQCEEKKPIVDQIENFYGDNITIIRYEVDNFNNIDNYTKLKSYGFKTFPAVVVKNISIDEKFNVLLPYEDITFDNIKNAIEYHLKGNYTEAPPETEDKIIDTPFGKINLSELSLSFITIVLAAADSFNPCSFFIFLFLLSLLLHMHSRRRMLVVAGIFIFFSGFFYFLIMAALLNIFLFSQYQLLISIIA